MTAPDRVLELVERYRHNRDSYHSAQYNEAQLRKEFIDPFFKILGWDVENEQGFADAYKDVVQDGSLKIGGATKAPDYAFRIGGTTKFFVEAKQPAVSIVKDPPKIHQSSESRAEASPYFQLRRYAWSAKLSLSILTNFENFAIYDCRNFKPAKTDKASKARICLLSYEDYVKRWDEIAAILSRDAILKGSFDIYAETAKTKKGTAEVDSAFLKEIEEWREVLAKAFAIKNPELSVRDLNLIVQSTIDRIIFIRICEDRGIETYGRLKELTEAVNVYERLCELYLEADERYNSGLFYFYKEDGRDAEPDTLSLKVGIRNKPLKDIIRHLYYPDSPYEFSVLSADILGQVYEQFLGKIIRLTPEHRAKVETKPEVKRAGGIYYTPLPIVGYIVENTVGSKLKGGDPKTASDLRILDPACGSGSFLINAYQYLLDWHLSWYVSNIVPLIDSGVPVTSKKILKLLPDYYEATRDELQSVTKKHVRKLLSETYSPIYKGQGNNWRLTTHEKKRILLSNIYGVDVDQQAVEVTKLSLLLKVLEGENNETISQQMKLFHERALPDLSNNIKSGNSLINFDFYRDSRQINLYDSEAQYKINAFDWESEFLDIFSEGGFDVILGNPPYGADYTIEEEEYFRSSCKIGQVRDIDSYALFIEKGLSKLKDGGFLSFITPDTFLRKNDRLSLRELLLQNCVIDELIETGPVFSQVRDTWCLVFRVSKRNPETNHNIKHKKISRFVVSAEERLHQFEKREWDFEGIIEQAYWLQRPGMIIGYLASEPAQALISKIENNPRLGDLDSLFHISRGEEGSKFKLKEDRNGNFFMVIPADVKPYFVSNGLKISDNKLSKIKLDDYYCHPKIWITRIQKMRWKQRIVCGLDERTNSAAMKTLQMIVSQADDKNELRQLQGMLSSTLINFWCVNYLSDDMNKSYLENLPVALGQDDRFVEIAKLAEYLQVQQSLTTQPSTAQSTQIVQRVINETKRQIDSLVYDVYGINEEERRFIETSMQIT